MRIQCNIAALHAPEKSSSVARSVVFHFLLRFTLKNIFFLSLVHQVMCENVPGAKYLSATTWGDFAPVLQGHFGFAPRNIFFFI